MHCKCQILNWLLLPLGKCNMHETSSSHFLLLNDIFLNSPEVTKKDVFISILKNKTCLKTRPYLKCKPMCCIFS